MNRTLYIHLAALPDLDCSQSVLANLNIYELLFMFIVFILIYDTQIKDRNLASPILMRLNKSLGYAFAVYTINSTREFRATA